MIKTMLYQGGRSIALILAIFSFLYCACSKEESIEPVKIMKASASCQYLMEYERLGLVPLSTIESIAKTAGYPQFLKYLKHSIILYKITYQTTFKGEPVVASGIIVHPAGKTDSIPFMIVGNGLIFADDEAPSEFKLPNNYTGFEFIASMGYYTLIPDMIGFGSSKDILFPMHNYEHSANTMIDFIRAGEEFLGEIPYPVTKEKLLTGYSQGAYIAMATLKMLQEKAITDIEFDAAVVGAGGFNLVNLLNRALEYNYYSAPSHLAMLLSSYNEIYNWSRPISYYFQEPYASRIPDLLSGKFSRAEIDSRLTSDLNSLLNPDFVYNIKHGNEAELMDALSENCVDDWAPESQLSIIHSIMDDRIPVSDSQLTYEKMIEQGSLSVSFTTIETEGHVQAGLAFVEMALQQFSH